MGITNISIYSKWHFIYITRDINVGWIWHISNKLWKSLNSGTLPLFSTHIGGTVQYLGIQYLRCVCVCLYVTCHTCVRLLHTGRCLSHQKSINLLHFWAKILGLIGGLSNNAVHNNDQHDKAKSLVSGKTVTPQWSYLQDKGFVHFRICIFKILSHN